MSLTAGLVLVVLGTVLLLDFSGTLHLTFGSLIREIPGVPARLQKACAAEPVYTRLGAVFHDLPYYRPELGNMAVESVRYFLDHRDAFAYATDNPTNPYHYLEPPSRTQQRHIEE